MRPFKVITTLKRHHDSKILILEDIFILGNGDDLEEQLQMNYGCWFDIVKFDYELIAPTRVHISKTYLIEQAKELVKFE